MSGAVTLNCSIAVNAASVATNLNLTAGQSGLLVATVTEDCKDKNGYTVTLTSNNGFRQGAPSGLLVGSLGNRDTLAYSVSYDNTPIALVNGSAVVTSVSTKTGPHGVIKNLAISYSSSAGSNADTYTDTIVLSLVGN